MKLYKKHNTLIIESENIVKFAGFIAAGKHGASNAKAAAFFPFVFVRNEEYATQIFINHEKIHFAQQIETLFIGSWLVTFAEDFYSRVFLKLKEPEYYLYRAIEQEAYRNQNNMDYLKNRKVFSLFKYLGDKKKLSFVKDKAPEIVTGDVW